MFSNIPKPWATHKEEEQKEGDEEDQSLTTILSTTEQRTDLTLLVANVSAAMRLTITDTFDPKKTGTKADMEVNLSGDEALRNAPTDLSKVDVEQMDKQRAEQAKRDAELSAPKMTELRDAALRYFDEWRDNVIQRVGEVVNSAKEAIKQVDEVGEQPKRARSPPAHPLRTRTLSPTPTPKQDAQVESMLQELYPPIDTPLAKLDESQRKLVVHSMLLLLLSLEHYSAHSRILILQLTSSLRLSIDFLVEDESKVARALLEAANKMNADEETKKKADENASSRKWKVGLASVAGAALIGVTGGLAAPLLAAGVGSVMSGLGLGATAAAGYLGSMAGSTVLVGGLFGAYGGRMTGQMMDQYAKEVDDFAFLPVRNFHRPRKIEKEFRRLRVAVGISGWLTKTEEVVEPWKMLSPTIEAFALRWELESLLNLGNSIKTMLSSAAWGYAKSEIIKRTVFSALTAGLWPLGLLKVSRIIDNPFSVAKSRSEKAGEVLADALINKAQGERPVTLIGYSLGARVIFVCLQTLAERKAFGLVESVVLLGAPCASTAAEWRKLRSVVSGRVVNVYSEKDYILGFLYRSSALQFGVAGLQPIANVKGVQNVDVSDIVSGHTQYRFLNGTILKKIGFEDVDLEEVAKEEEAMKKEKAEEERKQKEKEAQRKEGKGDDEQEAKDMEKEVEQKNQQSMMEWASEKLSWSTLGSKTGKPGDESRAEGEKAGESKQQPQQQGHGQ